MRLSLTASGLLDQRRLNSWLPSKRAAIRKAVEAGMRAAGREIAEAVRGSMRGAFKVRKAAFLRSMRAKVFASKLGQLPALYIGSKIPWLGIHERGGTIGGKLLIPLLPDGQRMGRKAFKRVIDGLLRSNNAFFVKKQGYAVLMAENIRENASELRRFKRAERLRTGARSIRRGQEVPIAVLVPRVTLRKRFDLEAVVKSRMPVLTSAIIRELNARGL